MNSRNYSILGAVAALVAAGSLLLSPAAPAQAAEEEVQVLTRGPVHEAFAESVSFEPEPGMIISTRAPELIEELPPEQQLEGDNVTWIPGYWAWDDDQNDFIWISGIWRNLPPGRQWVPGYWDEIDGGRYQWTSGYWADATTSEVSYVSTAPPRNVDTGPNIEAPSENHSWIPGNWFWVDTRYVWRPGYWVPMRSNWTWVPSRYCWTRRGYVYVDGYWDYAVVGRGVLFAPLYFHHHVYTRPDYYYTPSIVVALNVFSDHLFVRPRCSHYYFGDYYAPRYREAGFYASFSWYSGRRGYDPIYAYDCWDHRRDHEWERRRRAEFDYFRDHEEARPAHTWAAMRGYREDRFTDGRNRSYATSLSGFAKENKSGQRFRTLDEGRRQQFVSQRQEMRKFGQERRQMESRGRVAGDSSKKIAAREKLTRSPIIGREVERFAKDEAPPKRPEARGDKTRVVQGARNKPQNGVTRKNEPRDSAKRQEPANERKIERGVASRDAEPRNGGKAAPSRPNREGNNGKVERPAPRRQTDAVKEAAPQREVSRRQEQVGPQHKAQPKPQVRPTPDRREQTAPKHEVQPKPQVRKVPQPQAKVVPQRQFQPKPQARPAPDRKAQAAPKRDVRPKPQVHQAPQRKAQAAPQRESRPRPQVRQAPKPQAVPQRKIQSESQGNKAAAGHPLEKMWKRSPQ